MRICFRILSLKTKDTSASIWLFDFVSYFLARYKNEKKTHITVILRVFCKDVRFGLSFEGRTEAEGFRE